MVNMLKKILIISFFVLCWSKSIFAAIDLGVGYSSMTSSQKVPSLLLNIQGSGWGLDFTSTGYQSQYDYFSGYSMAYYWTKKNGTFLWRETEGGFGFGGYFTQRGFRAATTSSIASESDFGIGPAFFMNWNLTSFLFVRMQAMLGIGSANNVLLFFQDASNISVGVRW